MKETVSYELADIGTRFIAAIIDGFIIGLVNGLLFGAAKEAGGILSTIITFGYYWYFWTRNNGQTPGKTLMKIRVVKKDGTPIRDADAIVRVIGYYISGAIFLIGFLWALWDENRQGWHDKLANTYVVKAES